MEKIKKRGTGKNFIRYSSGPDKKWIDSLS